MLLIFSLQLGCGGNARDDPGRVTTPASALFVERAAAVGLDFTHFAGISGQFFFCEIVGPGGALFDYDRDGDLDVYLVQGNMLGEAEASEARFPPPGPVPLTDRLFRNELVESGQLRFTDVTETAGLRATGYGMGVSIGDYDRDGWPDVYVTNFGDNELWRNRGDGTFEDVTEAAGAGEGRWSTSAAFVDYDGDGWLDLYVCNYVDFRLETNKECFAASSSRDYCGPLSFEAVSDRLLRNQGDGTFADASIHSGIARARGSGLGVSCSDFNGDGAVDLYVANDGRDNQLWINRGDGRFENEALLAGCAFNGDGKAEASMGVDAADFDGDGDDDLFMTHLDGETNTLYLNDGRGFFRDGSFASGLGVASRAFTGFGTAWFDFDNDGWLDVFVANGAVKSIEELAAAGDPLPLHQTNQLFRNLGDGRFEEVTQAAGPAFDASDVSRGAAFGDVDNDGDVDVIVTNNSGPVRLLLNEAGGDHHWLGVHAVEPSGKLDAIGARVELVHGDGRSTWRRVRVAGSYCSANDPRVLFGLGDDPTARVVRVHFADGGAEEWDVDEVDRHVTLERGTGRPLDQQ